MKEGNMSFVGISQGYAATAAQVLGRGFRSSFVSDATPVVFVLDEDPCVREALELAICHEGWRCETFTSTQEFLTSPTAVVPNCLVLDASLPSSNALDLQRRIAIDRPCMSIIFVASGIDVDTAVRAMKAGAVEFLTKPFSENALLTSIREAIDRSRVN